MLNDDAYNNRGYIPDADDYVDRWAEDARQFRETEAAIGRARLNTAYGRHEREKFDLFHPSGRPAGLVVFVHGGYWRLFDRSYWSHFAQGAVARGWAVAVPSYPLCPEVRIAEITRSISTLVAAAAGYVAGPIALTGHSAGGHLVARMLCRSAGLPGEVSARITHVAPISPVSDLRPLIETEMNGDFRLDEVSAAAESPALLQKNVDASVSVWVGGEERPAFLDQARWLARAWEDARLEVVPGRHHFNVIDMLRDPNSVIVKELTAKATGHGGQPPPP